MPGELLGNDVDNTFVTFDEAIQFSQFNNLLTEYSCITNLHLKNIYNAENCELQNCKYKFELALINQFWAIKIGM